MAEKESKCCRTCKWYSDEVSCNVDSGFRAELRLKYQVCEKWRGEMTEKQRNMIAGMDMLLRRFNRFEEGTLFEVKEIIKASNEVYKEILEGKSNA